MRAPALSLRSFAGCQLLTDRDWVMAKVPGSCWMCASACEVSWIVVGSEILAGTGLCGRQRWMF